jgi:hypothetical protein
MNTILLAGVAAATLLALPGKGFAQSDPAALEARIAQLEARLAELRGDVAASRAAQTAQNAEIIRLDRQVAAVPAVPATAPPPVAPADGFRVGAHTVRLGGVIKLDAAASRYGDGDPANGDALREFYLPGSIPVGGTGENTETDFNARQTRLWFTTEGLVAGRKIGSRVEMDFQVLPGAGDQRTTSPANLSLRRAYVTIDNWLLGQEWSNFQNIGALPETADYIGPSEGTVFSRQAQIRYTRGPFSVSVENPETTISPFTAGARIVADDNAVPDVTARYVQAGPWGDIVLAGLVRQLRYEAPTLDIDSATLGWGVSASGKIRIGTRDDLRFMMTGGEGIGRYVGLNFANDAVLDAGGDLEAIPLLAGFAAYRHIWTPGWRSNLIWSAQNVDNDTALTGLAVNRSAQSLRANLIWTPVAGLDVGAELMFGERQLESGASGDMSRLSMFAKFGF